MNLAVVLALALLVGLLILVSYVDRVYQEIGKFLSRDFQDNIDIFERKVEPRLGVGRGRASLSMAILTQLIMAAIALLVGYLVFDEQGWGIYEILQAAITLILIVTICNRFIPFVFFSRTTGAWLVRWTLLLRILIYLVLPDLSLAARQPRGRRLPLSDRRSPPLEGCQNSDFIYAAASYSWMSPPRTSRLRTFAGLGSLCARISAPAGGRSPTPRCGLASL